MNSSISMGAKVRPSRRRWPGRPVCGAFAHCVVLLFVGVRFVRHGSIGDDAKERAKPDEIATSCLLRTVLAGADAHLARGRVRPDLYYANSNIAPAEVCAPATHAAHVGRRRGAAGGGGPLRPAASGRRRPDAWARPRSRRGRRRAARGDAPRAARARAAVRATACASRRPRVASERRFDAVGTTPLGKPLPVHRGHPRGVGTRSGRRRRARSSRTTALLRRGHPPQPRDGHVPPELLRLPLLQAEAAAGAPSANGRAPSARPRPLRMPTSAPPRKPPAPPSEPNEQPTPRSRPASAPPCARCASRGAASGSPAFGQSASQALLSRAKAWACFPRF